MKKKYKNKKLLLKRLLRPSVIIIILLVIVQAVSVYYIIQTRGYLKEDSQRSLSNLINSTEEKRYAFPVIDVAENRVYIPEARIYLPLNDTTRNLRYDYRNALNTVDLYLSMRGIVGSQNSTEDPQCDKMVRLTQKKNDLPNFVSEIETTKDGLRYIYRHDACEIYYGTISDDLVEAAKQIKSY